MSVEQIIVTLGSCIFFMGLVAWISYQKTKGETDTKDGYFLAGRGLTGIFIASSVSNIAVGLLGFIWLGRRIRGLRPL